VLPWSMAVCWHVRCQQWGLGCVVGLEQGIAKDNVFHIVFFLSLYHSFTILSRRSMSSLFQNSQYRQRFFGRWCSNSVQEVGSCGMGIACLPFFVRPVVLFLVPVGGLNVWLCCPRHGGIFTSSLLLNPPTVPGQNVETCVRQHGDESIKFTTHLQF
jgi:hypothetical protein